MNEKIAKLRELREKSSADALAGVDGTAIVACYGYHPETEEYEWGKYADFGTPEDAEYAYESMKAIPEMADEIERLQVLTAVQSDAFDLLKRCGFYFATDEDGNDIIVRGDTKYYPHPKEDE